MPAGDRLTGGRAAALCVLALGASALTSGCGAQGPQLPTAEANRVAAALAGITEACGESYQHEPGAPSHAGQPAIVSAASMRAHELVRVASRDPQRIYQAETMREVRAEAAAYLRDCGLAGAAAGL